MVGFSSIRDATRQLIKRHALLTNCTITGTLFGLGDTLEQTIAIHIQKERTSYDWARTARTTACGALVMGPMFHYWFRWLDGRWIARDPLTVVKKTALDQGTSPAFLFAFFCGMGALEKKNATEIMQEVREKFGFVFLVDCCVWIPVQAFNFAFISAKYRIPFLNAAYLFWNTFLCYAKNTELPVLDFALMD